MSKPDFQSSTIAILSPTRRRFDFASTILVERAIAVRLAENSSVTGIPGKISPIRWANARAMFRTEPTSTGAPFRAL
jgi:hypothetical protein